MDPYEWMQLVCLQAQIIWYFPVTIHNASELLKKRSLIDALGRSRKTISPDNLLFLQLRGWITDIMSNTHH